MQGLREILLMSAVAPMIGAYPATALAQQADLSAGGAGEPAADIVVTAQRRQERLQDVPVSVAVVDGSALQARGVLSLEQVTATLPTVRVVQSAGDRLFIRGVGSGDNNPLFEQSVATFIDGIYRGRARASAGAFVDLARVEVLKGPQSVYFGNNAIAGVFNIVSRDPGESPDGYVRALHNFNLNRSTLEMAYGGPVTDTLGVRFAGNITRGNGWVTDDGLDGLRVPRVRTYIGRVTAVWKPTDRLSLNVKAQAEHTRQAGFLPIEIDHCPPDGAFAAGPAGFCRLALTSGADVELNHRRATSPGGGYDLDNQLYAATLTYDANQFKLTSITGYTDLDFESRLDADASVPVALHFTFPERFKQFSQEFRLDSQGTGWLGYNLGAYFQSEDLHVPIYYNYALVNRFLVGPFALLAPYAPFGAVDDARQKSKTYAFYGSLTLKPMRGVELTVGGRQTFVDKDIVLDQYFGTASTPYGPVSRFTDPALRSLANAFGRALALGIDANRRAHRSDEHFSPSIILAYKPSEALNVYAKYVNGFKAGGYNSTEHEGRSFTFEPEYVDAYEIGLKGSFLDQRLQLSIAAFRNKFKGLQNSVSNLTGTAGGVTVSVANVGSSIAKGVEFEARLRASDRLSAAFDFSLLDSYYTDYPNAGGTALDVAQGRPIIDLTGKPTRYAPDYSGNFSVNYELPLTADINVALNGNMFFSDSYNISANNDQFLEQPGYVKLDASIRLSSPRAGWEISLTAKNLTDRKIRAFGANLPSSPGSYVISTEEPRNIAVQLRYNF